MASDVIVRTGQVIALPAVVRPYARRVIADVDVRDEKVEG
jgi:hypothetical protein